MRSVKRSLAVGLGEGVGVEESVEEGEGLGEALGVEEDVRRGSA